MEERHWLLYQMILIAGKSSDTSTILARSVALKKGGEVISSYQAYGYLSYCKRGWVSIFDEYLYLNFLEIQQEFQV